MNPSFFLLLGRKWEETEPKIQNGGLGQQLKGLGIKNATAMKLSHITCLLSIIKTVYEYSQQIRQQMLFETSLVVFHRH